MSVLFVLVVAAEFAAVATRQARLASRLAVGTLSGYMTGYIGGGHD
jgi:hypothetical protein